MRRTPCNNRCTGRASRPAAEPVGQSAGENFLPFNDKFAYATSGGKQVRHRGVQGLAMVPVLMFCIGVFAVKAGFRWLATLGVLQALSSPKAHGLFGVALPFGFNQP